METFPNDRVYPRVGGGAVAAPSLIVGASGLSPRGRGSQLPDGTATIELGSIPAWAGEPGWIALMIVKRRVYPRVGGGAPKV